MVEKLSHFGQNVWKYWLINTVMVSFNITVRRMTEMSQWPKCLSQKWVKCLCEKNGHLHGQVKSLCYKQAPKHIWSVLSCSKNSLFPAYCKPMYACRLWSKYTQTNMKHLCAAYNAYPIMHYIPKNVSVHPHQCLGQCLKVRLHWKCFWSACSMLCPSRAYSRLHLRLPNTRDKDICDDKGVGQFMQV